MKKLLHFLLLMVIVNSTFAQDNKWKGGSSGDWQNSANWTAVHKPQAGENIIFNIGGTVDCYNIPTVTLNNMYIMNNTSWVATDVTLRTGTLSTAVNDGQIITFVTSATPRPGHIGDLDIEFGCSLNCNVTNQRVQVICAPGIRFLIQSINDGGWKDAHFHAAMYDPCEFEKGLVLQSGLNYLGVYNSEVI